MKVIRCIALAATFVMALLASANAACDPGEIVIKFSHVTNTDKHLKGIAASLLEERVNREMNGKACMEVFPSSRLFNDNEVLEAILRGDVQMAAPSLPRFEKYTKKLRIFDLPFMFANIRAVDAFQASEAGQSLKDSMLQHGLKGLAFWHNGMKQMSASKPLMNPEDARGLKFRVQTSEVLAAQFEQLGASAHRLSFSELYDSLQSGVVDGQENTWSNIFGQRFFEVQNGITETNHGVISYMVVTSDEWWRSLEASTRDQLAIILREVTEARNREAFAFNQENKAKIFESGGTIRTLTPEQRQQWVDALKPVWEAFESDVGKDLIDAAQAIN